MLQLQHKTREASDTQITTGRARQTAHNGYLANRRHSNQHTMAVQQISHSRCAALAAAADPCLEQQQLPHPLYVPFL
jgi:hypothetical protein